MTIPLIILAVLSIGGGWIGLPDGLLWGNALVRFLAPSVGVFKPLVEGNQAFLSLVATVPGLIGIALAYLLYIASPELPARIAAGAAALYKLLLEKYYIDQIYDWTISRPLFFLARYALYRGVDTYAIDGLVDGTGLTVEVSGEVARRAETGNVQHYAFVYLLGAVAIAGYYIFRVLH